MTRYEKGDRNPSEERLKELEKIFLTNINLIKQYDFKTKIDIIYFLWWLEELFPRLGIDLSSDDFMINNFLNEWKIMRGKILPSEKAFAYKMKIDAIKHQDKKLTCTRNMSKSSTLVGKENNDSREKVRKFIRLTYLILELLKLVDESYEEKDQHKLTMFITPAVELSYLSIEEQKLVYSVIRYEDRTPSHGQTRLIRKLSNENKLNFDSVEKNINGRQRKSKRTNFI